MTTLPKPSTLLTTILDSLSTIPVSNPLPANPFKAAPPSTKTLFLALHCLFPAELLPALDVLDRQLVTCLILSPDPHKEPRPKLDESNSSTGETGGLNPAAEAAEKGERREIYYVRSSQPTRRLFRGAGTEPPPSYEVRLGAWNCSCPAFTFAAFAGVELGGDDGYGEGIDENWGGVGDGVLWRGSVVESKEATEGWGFGGLRRIGGKVPVCKHLLACILLERCPVLTGFVEERAATKEEMIGWAAGWA